MALTLVLVSNNGKSLQCNLSKANPIRNTEGSIFQILIDKLQPIFRRIELSLGTSVKTVISFPLIQYSKEFNGQKTLFIVGPRTEVTKFIPNSEFGQHFGGAIVSRPPPEWDKYDEWVGVWGNRNCSRFRRLLKERGAQFTLQKTDRWRISHAAK